jgi:hypothetical protein
VLAQEVSAERRRSVLVITINRPQAKNALNRAAAEGIRGAVDELDADTPDRGGGRSRKDHSGGQFGGKMQPPLASGGQPPLVVASVRAGRGLYRRHGYVLVVHGKEKVYGSIPFRH